MNRGNQVVAPNGFECLQKGVSYVYMGRSEEAGHATFVGFNTQDSGRRVQILRLKLDRLEYAITPGIDKIILSEKQNGLPPWLQKHEGSSIENIDEQRKRLTITHTAACKKRHGFICDLVPKLDVILAASNPFSIINAHAKACIPKQNRTRLAEWYFSFMCFGEDQLALLGDDSKSGTWSRTDEEHIHGHYGRENQAKGRDAGYASALYAEQCQKSYKKRAKLGVSLAEIYRDALTEDFGCRSRKNGDQYEKYHPQGRAFPDTYGKFKYQVHKKYSVKEVQQTLYGQHHIRVRKESQGSYSENLSNALQQGEVDGYFVKERPLVPLTRTPGERLCVVRGVCTVSKYTFGVGFSSEGESAEAYNSMLFCAAVGMEKCSEYFGLNGAILPVLSKGIPARIVIDRGAAAISAMNRVEAEIISIREQTETYSGRSKPNVEAGHPRAPDIDGPPTYQVSNKNIIELAQREFCRAAKDNHTSTVSDLQAGVGSGNFKGRSPSQLFEELARRGRNDAIQVPFETAVRRFLKRRTLEMRDGGVWYLDRRFSSDEFAETETFQALKKGQTIEVRAFTLSLCLTHVWIDFEGKLLELKIKPHALQRINDDFTTAAEVAMVRDASRRADALQRDSKDAAEVEARALYKETTGKSWSDAEQRSGTPKARTPEKDCEKDIVKGSTRGRRAA